MLCQCAGKKESKETFTNIIYSLIRATDLDEEYKNYLVIKRNELLESIGSKLVDKKKIILVDIPKISIGFLYVFDDDQIYTYDQSGEVLTYSNGFASDSSGWLKRYFLAIRDSTLEKLEIQGITKVDRTDRRSVHVFYLDNNEKVYRFFNLN
jgi:hypothetical protein